MDLSVFASFSTTRLLVVGDVMLDRYLIGDCERISPEAPVPVVKIESTADKLGGAANVARNISRLGAKVALLGIIGDDEEGRQLCRLLEKEKILHELLIQSDRPTITKLRIISRHQQVVRVDREERFDKSQAANVAERFIGLVADYDAVVFSDYNKGSLTDLTSMLAAAKRAGKLVLIDPKKSDYGAYAGADIVTPNLGEFEAAGGDVSSEMAIAESARELLGRYDISAMLLTRGAKGMSVITGNGKFDVPAESREVSDVTGAGDTVVATLGVAMASGIDIYESAKISNIAAGIAVGRLGAVAVQLDEIATRMHQRMFSDNPSVIKSADMIIPHVRFAKDVGKTIVFTNGCFDVLHAGHVSYLKQARQLGDCLIVGLNTDASVRRLKGQNRPIHTYEQRALVLGALEAVDWIVPFGDSGDDTPIQLIKSIKPHVLVKGGDYTPETIVGSKEVIQWGGRVEIIELIKNCSTSSILDRL